MAAKVVIELTTQDHNLLVQFLRFAIQTIEDAGLSEELLDADDGERIMGEIA